MTLPQKCLQLQYDLLYYISVRKSLPSIAWDARTDRVKEGEATQHAILHL
jgi:hypothetical protein